MLDDTLKTGYATSELARNAMLKLRGQRDQLVNTVSMVRDIGLDLVRTEKVTKDLNMRRFLHLVVLYAIAILLFIAICLVLYYKLCLR